MMGKSPTDLLGSTQSEGAIMSVLTAHNVTNKKIAC